MSMPHPRAFITVGLMILAMVTLEEASLHLILFWNVTFLITENGPAPMPLAAQFSIMTFSRVR